MKLKMKIFEVAMVAEFTVETNNPEQAKSDAKATAKNFSQTLNWHLPGRMRI